VKQFYCQHSMKECSSCKGDREYREGQEWERQKAARDRANEINETQKAVEYCRMVGICQ